MRNVLLATVAASAVCAVLPAAADDAVGFREIGGTNVASGTVTLEGTLKLSPEATYMKTGAGTLEIPSASIDNAAPYSIDVVGGTLRLTGGTATPAAAVAPTVAQDAALWLDANSLEVGTTNSWADVRGGAGRLNVRSVNAATTWGQAGTHAVIVTNGMKCVYFGGYSGRAMKICENTSARTIVGIHHFFAVHGVAQYWGAVLGHTNDPTTDNSGGEFASFYLGETSHPRDVSTISWHIHPSAHVSPWLYGARFFMDGRHIDAYSEAPKEGFQLLEGDTSVKPVSANLVFGTRQVSAATTSGGDFLCEMIVFTNKLSETQRLDVERYLMAKWNLPAVAQTARQNGAKVQTPVHRGTAVVRVAEGASAEVATAEGEISAPFAFEGEGSVAKTGDGMMVVGGGASRPFTGDFALEGGSLLLRGGAMPPVAAEGGATWDAAQWPAARPYADGSGDATTGVRVVRSTGGAAGVFRKTGDGSVAVKGAAADVTRILVEGGILRLAGADTNAFVACDTGVAGIEVAVPNHSFEMAITPGADGSVSSGGDMNGWKGSSSYFKYITCASSGYYSTWGFNYPVPDGKQCMFIVNAGQANTQITAPRAGTYEISFFVNARQGIGTTSDPAGYVISKPILDVLFNGVTIGRVHAAKQGFVKYRCRFAVSAADAGVPRELRFASKVNTNSYGNEILIDDVHVRAVPGLDEAVPVTGGDFEMSMPPKFGANDWGKSTPFFSRDMTADGWTFSLLDESKGTVPVNGFVGIVASGMEMCCTNAAGKARHIPAYPYSDLPCGASSLAFVGSNGRAEMTVGKTVALAPGRWRLRGKAAMFKVDSLETPIGAGVSSGYSGNPTLAASVIREGGAEESLGTVAPASHTMKTATWPVVIEAAASENVRVALVQTAADGACLVDDLEFVPAAAGDYETNIFPDPGCEKASLWTTVDYDSGTTFNLNRASIAPYNSNDAWAWGCDCYDGAKMLWCRNNRGMSIPVTFPAAGLYRLTFHARTRGNSTAMYGRLPLRGYVRLSDDSEKEVFRITPTTVAFEEHSFLFEMPEAGERVFAIHGIGVPSGNLNQYGSDTADRSSFVDGISIVKVDDDRQAVPEVPATAKISVADGARLALDYAGTVKVESLTLGGVRVSGTVSAESHPGYITGMGRMEVEQKGFMMIVR